MEEWTISGIAFFSVVGSLALMILGIGVYYYFCRRRKMELEQTQPDETDTEINSARLRRHELKEI